MAKSRLDVYLVERGLVPSREKARSSILAGIVFVNGQRVDKAGTLIADDATVVVAADPCPYVSRGGYKLARAIEVFGLQLAGKTMLDIGASTGGFTDVALQNGAARVIAVDVGYGQLAWSLRSDPRVRCLERTNVRYLTPDDLGETAEMATIDVSFISLAKVLPAVAKLLTSPGEVMALIKPQFEAGREKVGKKGVVRDPLVHREVIGRIVDFAVEQGWAVRGLDYSPITGPEGNIEYLLWLQVHGEVAAPTVIDEASIADVVTQAHGCHRQ
ncbi:TlyA family RNA methyltransferase [Heliophilum fasciatum]|uniref:23S rRNA (Cytidine1920-2'-O)/16S rRNA (Cytidine1409-2'-O)-methyltransferase n=1 Tax=Heliophilum fasciatum TaxID=35700 RepID=A0A4R2RSG7_9FIRM|nr:TlyA family RNA methyltransferase [Heliophilum fasciatum]MCW2277343.1 23S rRNA (cytidine1920-2'-O)/16S rRNA (cytidine1409-2'-O)-methyltransferase [Heliophilum fasciatum]TCP67180.1 23S rRNA (cytidine1920-2'-O)/16S rRNA (cytidine1409-2'-O)-methyltransferase [Heliophilum fasciatum]